MYKILFFPEKNICVPNLPEVLRPVTRNTLIYYLALFSLKSFFGVLGILRVYGLKKVQKLIFEREKGFKSF